MKKSGEAPIEGNLETLRRAIEKEIKDEFTGRGGFVSYRVPPGRACRDAYVITGITVYFKLEREPAADYEA